MNWRTLATGTALAGLALALRLYGLRLESAWHDEVLTLLHLDAPTLPAYLRRAFAQDPYPRISPLYYVLQYAWAQYFGPGEYASRWLSVVLGVAAVPLVQAIGTRLYSPRAGAYAALFLALSMVHTYYSQEVRFYALLVVLALAALLGLVAGIQGQRWGWALNFAANGLLLFTHAFAPLCFLAQGLALLAIYPRRVSAVFAWGAAQGLWLVLFGFCLRWLGYAAGEKLDGYTDYAGGWRELANLFVVFAGGRFSNRDPGVWMPGGVSLDLPIAAALALLALYAVFDARRAPLKLLPAFWLVVPTLALFTMSQLLAPVFLYRYVLYSAAGFALLAGAGLAMASRAVRNVGLVLLSGALLYQALALPRPMRPDFRTAAQTVAQVSGDQAEVFTLKHHVDLAFRYYSPLPPECIHHYGGFDEMMRDACAALSGDGEVWVLVHLWDRLEAIEATAADADAAAARYPLRGLPPPMLFRLVPW